MAEIDATLRRTTRLSSKKIQQTSEKKSRRNVVVGTTTFTRQEVSDGRETESSSRHFYSSSSDNGISKSAAANYGDVEGDLWNRSSQTEGIFSTFGYSKTVDVLRDFRIAKENFLDCSAVKFLRNYLQETDERAKTGYTYASGLSYTPDGNPNPPIPNMSRYSLDHYARCTENGYDYSRSESALSKTSSSSFARGLDFSESSRSSFVSTPEPSRSLRDYLSMIYKRTVTTTTTKNSNVHENSQYGDDESALSGGFGRITPESRSGNDFAERHDQSYISSTASAKSSSKSKYSRSADSTDHRNKSVAVSRVHTPATAGDFSVERGRETQIRAVPVVSAVENITRRFIDIVTRRTITTSETINRATEEEEEERRRSWCLWPLLFLLFLLPVLGGIWWASPLAVREDAAATKSVIYNFYRDLSLPRFLPVKESENVTETRSNFTNITILPVQTTHKEQPINLPVVKDCCDDVQLVKSQVALILERLEGIRRDDTKRDEWQKQRESTDDETRRVIDELRLMLVRVEKEMINHGQKEIVPRSVQERENFSLEDVRRMVVESIRRYDEDKTGEPDHALESSGATVISTRCSEDYKWGHSHLLLFGIPIPFTSWTTSPRLAIQPDMRPGQCWAFKGDQGYLVIKLTGHVRPTSFSLEHLPKNLSPTGKIDSAPKDFEVYGLVSEQGPGYILGKYTYEDNGFSLQNFQIQTKLDSEDSFPFVELRITSNHGHPDYTCLYRFRVHGILVQRDV